MTVDEQDREQVERCIRLGSIAASRYRAANTKDEKDAAWNDICRADMFLVRARIRLAN